MSLSWKIDNIRRWFLLSCWWRWVALPWFSWTTAPD